MKVNWKYTLGEIIIVIIGISIAFALNSWAAANKEKKSKKQYLESILTDVKSEINGLAADTIAFDQKMNSMHGIYEAFGRNSDRLDTLTGRFFEIPNAISFEPNDVTYRTLINSGNIGILSNFNLTKALEAHYANHAKINQAYKRQTSIIENYFGPMMIYDLEYISPRVIDPSIFEKKETRNIINSMYGSFNLAKSAAKNAIIKCAAIEEKLVKELASM